MPACPTARRAGTASTRPPALQNASPRHGMWICAVIAAWTYAQPGHAQTPAHAAAGAPAPPREGARSEPWPRRERQGVVLEQPVDSMFGVRRTPLPPNVIRIQEARRLGLRPLPRRSTTPKAWPTEPDSPTEVDAPRFARALAHLCPKTDPGVTDATVMADAILSASNAFDVDPFLLAGVVYQQSQCHAQRADAYGIGLTRINPGMFQRGMQHRSYRYGKPDGKGSFQPAELSLERYAFTPAALRSPKVNAYFAAALISVFEQQCPAIDKAFGSVPHRHYVSHFVWGDRVRSTMPEDEILIARRRLLYYYAPFTEIPAARVGDVALSSPLDTPPRIVIGVVGEPRDNGRRIHRGIDMGAGEGEPVHAMAPGVVTFAGVDLRERGLVDMPSSAAERVAPGAMGPRGLFVRVEHQDGIETLYVHLANYEVSAGQTVKRGQLLGVVGRTGVHASDAHLHLGLFVDGLPIDPLPVLHAYAVRAIAHKPREPGATSCTTGACAQAEPAWKPGTAAQRPQVAPRVPPNHILAPSRRAFPPPQRHFGPSQPPFAPSQRAFAPARRPFAPSQRAFPAPQRRSPGRFAPPQRTFGPIPNPPPGARTTALVPRRNPPGPHPRTYTSRPMRRPLTGAPLTGPARAQRMFRPEPRRRDLKLAQVPGEHTPVRRETAPMPATLDDATRRPQREITRTRAPHDMAPPQRLPAPRRRVLAPGPGQRVLSQPRAAHDGTARPMRRMTPAPAQHAQPAGTPQRVAPRRPRNPAQERLNTSMPGRAKATETETDRAVRSQRPLTLNHGASAASPKNPKRQAGSGAPALATPSPASQR